MRVDSHKEFFRSNKNCADHPNLFYNARLVVSQKVNQTVADKINQNTEPTSFRSPTVSVCKIKKNVRNQSK